MADWPNTLITALAGLAGVVTGGFLQARFARERERLSRLYEPAADLSSKLRGSATSVDYLIRPLIGEVSDPADADAYEKAKHLIDEADARRAGTEFAFPDESQVFQASTIAVEKLRAGFEAAKQAPKDGLKEEDKAGLVAARSSYNTAIQQFTRAARAEVGTTRSSFRILL